MATFRFYLEEMMAAQILFTVFFLAMSWAVLIIFVLDQALKVTLEWATVRLASVGLIALRSTSAYIAEIDRVVADRSRLKRLIQLASNYARWSLGRIIRNIKKTASLWTRANTQIMTIVGAGRYRSPRF